MPYPDTTQGSFPSPPFPKPSLAVIIAALGSLAQLVEQRTFNPLVAGSNPARPTKILKSPRTQVCGLFCIWRTSEDAGHAGVSQVAITNLSFFPPPRYKPIPCPWPSAVPQWLARLPCQSPRPTRKRRKISHYIKLQAKSHSF